ncbi:MAG: hypothetical protein N838_26590 [Thiohalocapsa sp. PB-PSB1]|nr:MAG: hypothetical protein N838_26590 [Thiohalocapsa sp. PB-PSB1]
MENSPNATPSHFCMCILGAFQNKRVMAVCVKAMIPGKSLIYQQGQSKHIGDMQGRVERRVFMPTHCMMHPVQDQLASVTDWMIR